MIPVVVHVSQATLAFGSFARIVSRMASEIWSQILSGRCKRHKKKAAGLSHSYSSSAKICGGNWHRCVSAGCRVSQGPVPQPLLISFLIDFCGIVAGSALSVNVFGAKIPVKSYTFPILYNFSRNSAPFPCKTPIGLAQIWLHSFPPCFFQTAQRPCRLGRAGGRQFHGRDTCL